MLKKIKIQTIMKNEIIKISILGLLAILSCGLIFYISCRSEDDCSNCQITQQEIALLPAYNQGDIAVFKNDTTGEFDTLHVTRKSGTLSGCSYPCNNAGGGMFIWCSVLKNNFQIDVWHSSTPVTVNTIPGIGISEGYSINFLVRGTMQSNTINNTTYNDIFTTIIDSTKVLTSPPPMIVPWKIYYSKSKGFVRFYMVNGQTWSKL